MSEKILVTGANGLLGQKVVEVFKRESEYELLSCDLVGNNDGGLTLDITDHRKVMEAVGAYRPSVIVNAAAFTNVDLAETEKEVAYKINATAVGYLADAAKVFNAKLVHISTDYVFDGKNGGYSEESLPAPISYYGKTKLAGENLVKSKLEDYAIIRTQILYGFGRNVKRNFVLWVVEKLAGRETIRIVDDQFGNPTLADELAFAILKVCQKNAVGLYHVAGLENISRYEFARKVAEVFGLDFSPVKKVRSDELAQPAKRPLNSSFICLKAQTELGVNMPAVSDSLFQMKQQMKVAGALGV